MTQATSVKVCLFTDIVDSVDLKLRLGDAAAVSVFERHDSLFRERLRRSNGCEVKHTGDGFFATFDVPSDAVNCALEFQAALGELNENQRVGVRIGIHMGEILPRKDSKGREDLSGLAVDVASRVMNLAQAGQVFMTRDVFVSARQHVRSELVQWLSHGTYDLKGVREPVEICQAGISSSPVRAPGDSDKANLAGASVHTDQYRQEVILEISLACHTWKNRYMDLYPGHFASVPGAFKDVWEMLIETATHVDSDEEWAKYSELFRSGIGNVNRRLDSILASHGDVVPDELKLLIMHTERQLSTEASVYEYGVKFAGVRMRIQGVLNALTKLSRGAGAATNASPVVHWLE